MMTLNTKAGYRWFIKLILVVLLSTQALASNALHKYADTVKVGTYIISLHDINFHDKEYTTRFWIWLQYKNPDFDFSNQIDVTNAKAIEKPNIIIDTMEDGRIWVMMQMKCTMKQSYNVGDFPFDKQHLKMRIENAMYDYNRLVFLPDTLDSAYDKSITIDGWDIKNFKVSQDFNEYETGWGDPSDTDHKSKYATYVVEMDIERNAWGLFLKIFIGMYIAFMIASVSFTIKPEELEPRFGLPVAGVLAAVGNKYIIDSLLPETSQFTLVDSLHTLTFMSILATIVVSSISLKYEDKGRSDTARRVDRIGGRIVVGTYIATNLLLVMLARF